MPVVLYHFPPSPPSRTALSTAKAVGLDVSIKVIDLLAKENHTEDYIKVNPLRTVPALDDNGLVIADSHAIATYIVSQYGKSDSLYPKDPRKRALVDQRLYFDATTLFPRFRGVVFPVLFLGKNTVEPESRAAVYEAVAHLEKFLETTGWLAGDHVTLADIACAVTASSLQAIGVDLSSYPKTGDWLQRCSKAVPGFQEANADGLRILGGAVRSRLQPKQLVR